MSDNPFDSLPPVPDDLWPKVAIVRIKGRPFVKDDLPLPVNDLAEILARCIQREMRSAGEIAAMEALAPPEPAINRLELRWQLRMRTESAARALVMYQAIHEDRAKDLSPDHPSPAQVKMAATKWYQIGYRDEMSVQQQIQVLRGENPAFNDDLYSHLKKKPRSDGPKFQS